MKAIEYVARADAGSVYRGSIPEGDEVTVIPAANGQEISLNLRQIDIEGYQRDGGNLILSLADGRVVVLEGYFGADGATGSRLFISADGYLNEVSLVEGSDGTLYAQYGPTETWGKWSPSDELIFLESTDVAGPAGAAGGDEVSMLGAGLLGLGGSGLLGAAGVGVAGLAATSLLAGGSDGSGSGGVGGGIIGGPPRIEPVVNEDAPIVIGGDDASDPSITITGEAEPGSDIEVSIGDKTVDTSANDDGEWEATFEGDDFPEDGEYDVSATVTEPDGTETTLDGPSITIDTTAPDVGVTDGLVSNGHIVNDDDFRDGVEIAGTGEVGATVEVTIDEVTETVQVGEDGTWRVEFDPDDLEEGDYDKDVTIVSTDGFGNSSTITETISIDTIYNDLQINADQVGDNGLVNKDWADDEGLVVTGMSEPGATVVVSMGDQSTTVTAVDDGSWEAEFDPYALPDTQYDATVTARTVDDAGNVTETSETIRVDLEVRDFSHQAEIGGSDGVINSSEISDGFTLTGTVEDGQSTVTLKFFDEVVEAQVNADGTWTASFDGNQIPPGEYTQDVQIIAQDTAGNTRTLTQAVEVDTEAGSLTLNGDAVGNNGVINHEVYEDGVMVTGTADPGASVVVTLGDVDYTVQADQTTGEWQQFYDTADLVPGDHNPELTATITDEHDNSYSLSHMLKVDTLVDDLSMAAPTGMPMTADGMNVINQSLADGGFELTGTVEPGSQVWVEIDGVPARVSVDQDSGDWTAVFDGGVIPGGTREADMIVRVQDPVGNLDNIDGRVLIDTEVKNLAQGETVGAVNGFANLDAARDGLELTGTVEPGSEVEVDIFGETYLATGDSTGAWSITVPRGDIPNDEGTAQMTIRATDTTAIPARPQGRSPMIWSRPESPWCALSAKSWTAATAWSAQTRRATPCRSTRSTKVA
ncbi:RTX toxin [Roseovarius gahaiensis]|uniref:RTX toxin n=1 Tax=Roseovarius gahaiensis TaxID=2716691 RepID=A0A967BCN8_9RHOB|nr:Ig-like domain-containing protein [Roseovarius gahaiensis]NHQ73814.1 RTX toxin [Roseovarius gahaiensis]